jgi:NADPH-dependent ferric siderophore reductase
LVRVTVAADELDRFEYGGPDQLVRIFLPPRLGAPLVLPKTERWWPEWQELSDQDRPVLRNYTVRAFDPVARRLSIDFVVHGTGPGSRFAQRARPGDELGVLSDGADYSPPEGTEWQLLVGDETALPAIGRWLEELPDDARGVAAVEVADPGEEQPLRVPRGVSLTWLHRSNADAVSLGAFVSRLSPPEDTATYVWAAGEAGALKPVRSWARSQGIGKDQSDISGYWRRGRTGTVAPTVGERLRHTVTHLLAR